ncbi:MAG TPA: DUF2059 domain-containing protein [bacterium]
MKRWQTAVAVAAAWLACAGGAAQAQEPGAGVSESKAALIRQLLDATDAEAMAERVTTAMLAEMERNYPQLLARVLEQENMDPDKRQAIQALIIESRTRVSERFRELYPQRVNFREIIREIYYPLYDKYFTEAELGELVEFYRSPIGQKTISVMPNLIQEAMQRSNELLQPTILEVIQDVMNEEKAYLQQLTDTAKPQGS